MSIYSNSAIGLYLNDTMVVDASKVKNVSFIIADGGTENIQSTKFPMWVQLAYDLDIPIIMRFQPTGDGGNEYNMGDFEKGFADPVTDLQMVAMKRSLSSRVVAGILLDVTDNTINNGVNPNAIIPEGNYANLIRWFYDNVWNQFKKPVYVFMSQSVIDSSYGSNYPKLMQYTSTDIGMSSWKSATPTNTITVQASWDAIPYPDDNYSPQYIANNGKIYFARFANSKYTFDGITDASGKPIPVPLYKYISSKEGLYKDLNFIPKGTVVVPPPVVTPPTSGSTAPTGPITTPISTVDYTAKLAEIKIELDSIYALLKTVFNR